MNEATAEKFTDRVNFYDENQIQEITNTSGRSIFSVDENRDQIEDYSFNNPNFSFAQLQTNLVVRWEYIPGSELFFVWARGSVGNRDAADSLRDGIREQVLNAPAEDTFLIKATYRFVR
ncbi:hypothetical protein [uncultured Polaribacter sp.]|uniref:hypothetical protein n=1 Tax=uncultured Polaribacter sp. TaxID=174711 RepID=UPI00342D12DD